MERRDTGDDVLLRRELGVVRLRDRIVVADLRVRDLFSRGKRLKIGNDAMLTPRAVGIRISIQTVERARAAATERDAGGQRREVRRLGRTLRRGRRRRRWHPRRGWSGR